MWKLRNVEPLKICKLFWSPFTKGAFHSTKIPIWNLGNFMCPVGRYIPFARTGYKPVRVWLLYLDLYLQARCRGAEGQHLGQQFCQMERHIQSDRLKWPDRSKWTTFKGGQKYFSLKPDRNGSFHLISDWTFWNVVCELISFWIAMFENSTKIYL